MKDVQKQIDKIVSKVLKETLEERAEELVGKIKSKLDDNVCEQCGSSSVMEGECTECGYMKESTYDEFDLNVDNEFDYVQEEDEVDEGNAFTGALAKAKKEGKSTFTVDGEEFHVTSESANKKNNKQSLQLTEDELIDVIEKLVSEEIEKSNIRSGYKPKGLSQYEKSVGQSKKDSDEYISSVTKKMKEYLKDGSKGGYETDPKSFPAGNGQLAKMDKMAYKNSKDAEDYIENFSAAGLENLDYDEIKPNEEWVSSNMEGSSKTGNNPKWANAVETDVNKKRNAVRKKNLLGKLKGEEGYNKLPQPVYDSEKNKTDDKKEIDRIFKNLESIEDKKDKMIREEFQKINRLVSYKQKTQ